MYRVTVNYNHPQDPQAFLAHYRGTHTALAKNLANVSSYTWGIAETLDGSTPGHFVTAVLEWPSKDAAVEDLGSPAGQEASADMANFAQAGMSMAAYEVEKVI